MTPAENSSRTCMVTREGGLPSELIRFVVGPDNQVVPDLNRKLPGRGVWVKAKKKLVEEAVRKNIFSRGFKAKVNSDESLPNLVEDLLNARFLSLLGLCKKSGLLVTGQAKCNDAIRSGAAEFVLHAIDAAEDGTRKLEQAVRTLEDEQIPAYKLGTIEEFDKALGGVNTAHIALLRGGAATKLEELVQKRIGYNEN